MLFEQIAGSTDVQRNDGFLISHSVVMISGVSLHLCSMNPTQLRQRHHNHTHLAILHYILKFIYCDIT